MALLAWLQGTSFARWVSASPSLWAYPSILTAHTIGLAILVGASVVLDLTLLGILPGVELRSLEKLFRIMWLGFWINAISGACLFAADATTKGTQTMFYVKMLFIALGLMIMLLIKRAAFRGSETAGAASRGRTLAAASLACWFGAIVAGRRWCTSSDRPLRNLAD